MRLPASDCVPSIVSANIKIDHSLIRLQNDIIKMVNNRNLTFFEEEVSKLDHWADDLKFVLEQSIKDTDQQIKEVRRNAKIAPTLEEKLALQKQQQELEQTRNKQRKA